jgi:hypothetical protein
MTPDTKTRRGRPPRDIQQLFADICALERKEPGLSKNEIARRTKANRKDVGKLVSALRARERHG